jgi:hypothetical protein
MLMANDYGLIFVFAAVGVLGLIQWGIESLVLRVRNARRRMVVSD